MNLRSARSLACLASLVVALPAAADTHSASPVHAPSSSGKSTGGSSHSASPVRRPSTSSSGWTSSSSVRWRPYRHTRYYRPLWWTPAPAVVVVGSQSSVSPVDDDGASDVRLGASGQVLVMGGKVGVGLDAALEGRHVGFFLEAAALPSVAGEAFVVADASVGLSLLSGEAGRLRLELGALSAILANSSGSGLAAAAPGVGVSGALAVAGPLLFTGRVRGAAWPYVRAEGQAAALLALGPVGIQLGWRTLYVADAYDLASAGSRFFSGPYVGLELAL